MVIFALSAKNNGGLCNLRFDDTNPLKEDDEYVQTIKEDVRWLGFDWEDRLYFASNYFQQLHDHAVSLIEKGLAYVCDLSSEEMRETRGTLTVSGEDSPYRERSIEKNLDLFSRMKVGEFPNGARTLRAKIDMSNSNLNMRDPVIYRILHASHHNTGNDWCIYPMYDWAHGLEEFVRNLDENTCSISRDRVATTAPAVIKVFTDFDRVAHDGMGTTAFHVDYQADTAVFALVFGTIKPLCAWKAV